MSSALIMQTKDDIVIGADTACSIKKDGKFIRYHNNLQKLFHFGDEIMYCSGKTHIVEYIVNRISMQENKIDKEKLRKSLCLLHLPKDADIFDIEILICGFCDSVSYLYQLSQYNDFKPIIKTGDAIGTYICVAGLNTEKCLSIANKEYIKNSGNAIPIYLNTYRQMICQEIGGYLNVYHLNRLRGISRLINHYKLDTISNHGLLIDSYGKQHGLIADALIGRLMMSEKLCISDGKGTTLVDGDGIKVTNGYLCLENEVNTIEINPAKDSIFTITKKKDNTKVVTLDSNGNAQFTGTITAQGGSFTGGVLLNGGYLTTSASRKAYNAQVPGLTLDGNGIGGWSSTEKNFTLTSKGELTATGVDISGTFNIKNIENGCIQIETSNTSNDYIIFNHLNPSPINYKQRQTKFTPDEFSVLETRKTVKTETSGLESMFVYTDHKLTLECDSLKYDHIIYSDDNENIDKSSEYSIDFHYDYIDVSTVESVHVNNLVADSITWNRKLIASNVTSYSGDLSQYDEIRIIMKCGDSVYRYGFNLVGEEIISTTQQYIEGYDNGSYTGVGSINVSTSGITIGQCRVGNTNYTGYLTIYAR